MSRAVRDPGALVAGLALVLLGLMVLLDRVGALDLSFGYLLAALCASGGAVLLGFGLAGRR